MWMAHIHVTRLSASYLQNHDYADTPFHTVGERIANHSKYPGLKLNIQKLTSWHLVPSLHGK